MKRAFKRFLSITLMMSLLSISLNTYASDDLLAVGNSSTSQEIGTSSVTNEITLGISQKQGSIAEIVEKLQGQELADYMRGLSDEDFLTAIDFVTEEQMASLEAVLTDDEKSKWNLLYKERQAPVIINDISQVGDIINASSFTKAMLRSVPALVQKSMSIMTSSTPVNPLTLSKAAEVVGISSERTYQINIGATLSKDIFVPAQCDIILLLDKSYSMFENNIDEYKLITANPVSGKTYYYKVNDKYFRLNKDGTRWYYNDKGRHYVDFIAGGVYQFYEIVSKTRLDGLKECANIFVSNVAEYSPESRVGIVSFSTDASVDIGLSSVIVNDQLNPDILSAIDNLEAVDTTATDLGMLKVQEVFTNDKLCSETRKKVVVFITDGDPHRENISKDKVKEDTIKYANQLKLAPYNSTIYSIGIFSNPSNSVKKFLTDVSGATGGVGNYSFTLNKIDELKAAFKSIAEKTQVKVQNVVIKDYINPNFDVVTASLPTDAILKSDINGSYVEWTKELSKSLPFASSFTVKAKVSFFGGNDIATNIDNISALYNNGTLVEKFPLPKVNVPISFAVTPKTDIFYVSENIDLNTAEQAMYNSSNVSNGTMSYVWNQGSTAVASETFNAINDGVYNLEVTYTPSSDGSTSVGTAVPVTTQCGNYSITVLKPTITATNATIFAGDSIALNNQISVNWNKPTGFTRTAPDLAFELFDASSKITNAAAYSPTKDKLISIKTNIGGFSLDTNNCVTYINNPFNVFVQHGNITVTKTIDKNHAPHGDPIFMFVLERYENGKLKQKKYDFVRFENGSISPLSVNFGNLPKGEYRLYEEKTIRYSLISITNFGKGIVSGDVVTFNIGLDNPTGEATYNNKKDNQSLFTHTDFIKNTFSFAPGVSQIN